MNKETQKDKSFAIIFWTLLSSIALIFPLIYFLFKLGFFDYDDNQTLVSIPVEFKKLMVEKSFHCGFDIRGTTDYFCIKSKYQYRYQGKIYFQEKVSSGLLLISKQKAEMIKEILLKKNSVYISPQKPEYSILINRKNYINYQPYDISSGWFSTFIIIPIIIFGFVALLGFNSLFRISKNNIQKEKIIKRYATLYIRCIALWVDISIFTATIVIFITFFGIFSLSSYTNKFFLIRLYVGTGFPLFVLFSWIIYSKTIGMYLTNLTTIDIVSFNKPTLRQFIIKFLGNIFILVTGGAPLFFAAFNKKKKTIADKLSDTVIIEEIIDYPYANKRLAIKTNL